MDNIEFRNMILDRIKELPKKFYTGEQKSKASNDERNEGYFVTINNYFRNNFNTIETGDNSVPDSPIILTPKGNYAIEYKTKQTYAEDRITSSAFNSTPPTKYKEYNGIKYEVYYLILNYDKLSKEVKNILMTTGDFFLDYIEVSAKDLEPYIGNKQYPMVIQGKELTFVRARKRSMFSFRGSIKINNGYGIYTTFDDSKEKVIGKTYFVSKI